MRKAFAVLPAALVLAGCGDGVADEGAEAVEPWPEQQFETPEDDIASGAETDTPTPVSQEGESEAAPSAETEEAADSAEGGEAGEE